MRGFHREDLDFHELQNGDMRITFTERRSKANQGGLKHPTSRCNPTVHIEDPNYGRSLTRVFQKYLQKMDSATVQMDKPWFASRIDLDVADLDEAETWFTCTPIGHNTLGTFVKDLMANAGIKGKWSNHSLRVGSITSLMEAGIGDGEIVTRSRHKCLTSVNKYNYKRPSDKIDKQMSDVLAGPSKVSIQCCIFFK